ncbi:MAG: putative oxidoreductase [Candidatus Moanabacter tarae]|uniref:Putative oxidoreductase n=1 Tax=Candidatus Moanibacter tarae TaxID=2200854 RepID=A0A2Z4AG72_9BACT|nr:MAG: putative oxidoreductase [Candidatus Moanabacter tarae]|tara:strand:+ start:2096 stop:2905 length:810 start_codon:yes stop_codon:yes gene_type:complete
MKQLLDKVIIVTGSTTGIGKAIARKCLEEGAKIIVSGRNRKRGEEVVHELGGAVTLHIDDLTDPSTGSRLVQTALKAYGKVDGIVNNAAWVIRSNLETTNVDLFDRVMSINVRAPLFLVKAAMPELIKTSGAIINIGSVNGYTGAATQLDYSISKAALMCLSRNLANAYAHQKVRINHLNVGWVITPNENRLKIKEGFPEGWSEDPQITGTPTGKMTQPEEIANHAIFWLSNASRPITGSVMELEQYPFIGRIVPSELEKALKEPVEAG